MEHRQRVLQVADVVWGWLCRQWRVLRLHWPNWKKRTAWVVAALWQHACFGLLFFVFVLSFAVRFLAEKLENWSEERLQ